MINGVLRRVAEVSMLWFLPSYLYPLCELNGVDAG
jgi:hypothetical protein